MEVEEGEGEEGLPIRWLRIVPSCLVLQNPILRCPWDEFPNFRGRVTDRWERCGSLDASSTMRKEGTMGVLAERESVKYDGRGSRETKPGRLRFARSFPNFAIREAREVPRPCGQKSVRDLTLVFLLVGDVVETPISTGSGLSSQSLLLPQSRDSFPRYVTLGILGTAPRLSADPRSSLGTRRPRYRLTCELSHVTGFFGQGLASAQSAVPSIPMSFHTFPCHVF